MKKLILPIIVVLFFAVIVAAQTPTIERAPTVYDTGNIVEYVDSVKIVDVKGKPIEGLKVDVVKFVLTNEDPNGAGHDPDENTRKQYTTDENGMIDLGFQIHEDELTDLGYQRWYYDIYQANGATVLYTFDKRVLSTSLGENPIVITATKEIQYPLSIQLPPTSIFSRYNVISKDPYYSCMGLGSGSPQTALSFLFTVYEGNKNPCLFFVYDLVSRKADYAELDPNKLKTSPDKNAINLNLDKTLQDLQDVAEKFKDSAKETTPLYKGWNLVATGKGGSYQKTCVTDEVNSQFMILINPIDNSYMKLKELQENKEVYQQLTPILDERGYFVFWYPTPVNCKTTPLILDLPKIDLKQGKNPIPVARFFVGFTVENLIKSQCDVEKISLWDPQNQNWKQLEDDYQFTGNEQGLVVTANSDCTIAADLTLPGFEPPSL